MSTTLIIVLVIAAALVLWGIKVQNQLVQADELCNNQDARPPIRPRNPQDRLPSNPSPSARRTWS